MEKRTLIAFLVFILLVPYAYATLQVTAFSCNSQTGTANVENGGNVVCQATVNNPDTGSASLTAATLYPSSSWTEDSSYSASGFSTTISAGASTTATFSGIRPTSSGLNTFSSIYLDTVRDTYAASTTVNVVDIKSLTASSSASSAATSATITITSSVLVGGNLDVTLSLSPSSCTLKTGETSSKNLGSLTHNSQGSASWQLTMGSSTCSYTITATGTKGSVSVSSTKSGTVSNPDSSGTTTTLGGGGSSGGGGGGGGGGNETTTTARPTTTTVASSATSTTIAGATTTSLVTATTQPSGFPIKADSSTLLMIGAIVVLALIIFFYMKIAVSKSTQ